MNCENCGRWVKRSVVIQKKASPGLSFVDPVIMCSETCYAEALIKQAEKVEEERNVKSHTAKP